MRTDGSCGRWFARNRGDSVFIDADKKSSDAYFRAALELSYPGTLIVVDNVARDGKVIDAQSDNPDIQDVRRLTDLVASEPRVSATVIQTADGKGHDGFMIACAND